MSVLIEGMEMPKYCDRCFIKPGYCPAIIKRMKSDVPGYTWIPANYRHEDCPLIEVPEPHGRLGDLDVLPWYLANTSVKYATYEDWEMLCDAIAAAPTVIPASEEGE